MIVEDVDRNGWSVSSLGDGAFWSFRDLMMTRGSHVMGAGSQPPRRGLDTHSDWVLYRQKNRYSGSHFHLRSQRRSLSLWRLTLELNDFWGQRFKRPQGSVQGERAASVQWMHGSLHAHPLHPGPLPQASLWVEVMGSLYPFQLSTLFAA